MKRLLILICAILIIGASALLAAVSYMTAVPGQSYSGALPALTDGEKLMARRLRDHIAAIATKPHNIERYAELEAAARYIEKMLTDLKYTTAAQAYVADRRSVRNIEAVIEPTDPARSRGTIVVGAHYDSYGEAPGANDNATGSAVVLELARLLADMRGKSDVRIRLVLFVNEEPPYFQTGEMGSVHYARMLKDKREPIIGMISLETMGYFRDQPGTQQYPPPFGWFYPSEGNFIAFVGMLESRDFVRAAVGSFRNHTSFPSVGGVAPGIIPGIDWSDHWSFAEARVPALMITDTAPFRYPHYHEPTDTLDKIDLERLARVAAGVERLIRDMASATWPTKPVSFGK